MTTYPNPGFHRKVILNKLSSIHIKPPLTLSVKNFLPPQILCDPLGPLRRHVMGVIPGLDNHWLRYAFTPSVGLG